MRVYTHNCISYENLSRIEISLLDQSCIDLDKDSLNLLCAALFTKKCERFSHGLFYKNIPPTAQTMDITFSPVGKQVYAIR